MATLDDWTQIPTSLLDLADKTQEAEQWASAQRAQLAETWANAQRNVLGAMANTWQQGTAALDNFRQGYSGTSVPSYNDMAGASSSYTDTNPPQPTGGISALDQATSPLGPQVGDQTAVPLGDVPQRLADQAAESRAEHFGAQDAWTRYQLGMGPEPSPEQTATAQSDLLNIGMAPAALELAGGTGNIIGRTALEQAPNLLKQLLGGTAPDVGNVAQGIVGQDTTRMYHGTGSAFERPEPGKFDPNGLFGPGYYLTTSPEVANSYSTARDVQVPAHLETVADDLAQYQRWLQSPSLSPEERASYQRIADSLQSELDAWNNSRGANVRAVDVPAGLRLLDAEKPLSYKDLDEIDYAISQKGGRTEVEKFNEALSNSGGRTGTDVWNALNPTGEADPVWARNILQNAGYDGIAYNGGKRIPLADANGQPIEHQAVAIFPKALGKLRNALSGTYGGLMNEAQAAKRTVTASEQLPGSFASNAIYQADRNLSAARKAFENALTTNDEGLIQQSQDAYTQAQTAFENAQNRYKPSRAYRPTTPTLSPVAKLGRQALIGAGQGAIGGGIQASQQPNATPGSIALGALEGAPGGAASALAREALPGVAGAKVGSVLSRVANAAGPTSQEGFAGNIRLEKLPQGVQDIVQEVHDQAPQTFENARRGVISDAEVAQLADQVGGNVNKIVQQWQPGQAKNAETLLALRNALASKAQDVATLKDAAAAPNASPADLLKFQAALRDQVALQQTVAGTTAEAGRALRQFRQTVSGVIASGDTQKITDTLNRLGGVEWTKELAGKLAQLDTTDPVASYQFMRDAIKPQFKDYLTELWYNAMLSGPKTHLVKSLSESLSLAMSPIERVASAAVEQPLAALQGRAPERFAGEAIPDLVGMAQGIPEGIQAGLFALQHGFRQSDVLGSDYIRTQAFRGPAGAVINFPSRLLGGAAEMMASIAQAGALNAGAYRLARMEGATGDALAQRMAELRANPTPALLKYAQDTGKYRVYQAPPGKTIGALVNLRENTPLGRLLVPFLQTPANLLKFGLTRSPLGVLNPTIYKNIANKSPEAADQIGRTLLGSMLAAGIALEFGKGNITGAAPTQPNQRDAWARQGKTPFSVRIGDNWYSYQRFEPLNQTFSQVASAVDALNSGKDPAGAAQQAIATIGANLVSQSYMQSLSKALEAIKDPSRAAGNFVEGMASSAVPAIVRVGTQTMDPTQRDVQGPLEAIQSTLPGAAQQLPATVNAFGQDRQRDTSLISPIAVSPSHVDPVDAELAKYNVEPGLTGKTLRGLDLTRQEAAGYQRVSGQAVKSLLDQVIRDPRYQQADDPTKARILQRAITIAKDQAAQTYIRQLAQQQGQAAILQRIQQKKLQRLPAAS